MVRFSRGHELSSHLFIQLPEVWGPPEPATDYRVGFHAYVENRAQKSTDRVILIEPNPRRVQKLRQLWADWPNYEVIEAESWSPVGSSAIHYWMEEDAPEFDFRTPVSVEAQQRFPHGAVSQEVMPVIETIQEILSTHKKFNIALVSVDLRRVNADGESLDLHFIHQILTSLPRKQRPAAVNLSSAGLEPIEIAPSLSVIRGFGYRPAGRLWGAAGASVVFKRVTRSSDYLNHPALQLKVRVGASIVRFRDSWLSESRKSALRIRGAVLMPNGVKPSDILDDRLARPLPEVPIVQLRRLLPPSLARSEVPWAIETIDSQCDEVAQDCFVRHGVWPISFSYPKPPLPIADRPAWLITPMIPGLPYSFESEADYLETYQRGYLGVTHRKAGWDCFRHVEIFASGAIPLMPDARNIPRFSMVHYPKTAMAQAAAAVKEWGSEPTESTRQLFREYFEKNLTAKAMAYYILRVTDLEDCSQVLFVDEQLPKHGDYQSVLTLIGLKEIFGANCHVMFPTDYIYQDTSYPVRSLYGRGFGYTALLPAATRSISETKAPIDFNLYDAVIVGSIARNHQLAQKIMNLVQPSRTIWIHGEDTPPSPSEVHGLRNSGAQVFVRAIHTGCSS